jgi:hypothetical protein
LARISSHSAPAGYEQRIAALEQRIGSEAHDAASGRLSAIESAIERVRLVPLIVEVGDDPEGMGPDDGFVGGVAYRRDTGETSEGGRRPSRHCRQRGEPGRGHRQARSRI